MREPTPYDRLQDRLEKVLAAALPQSVRGRFSPQYQEIGSLKVGSLVGLCCDDCGCWAEYCECGLGKKAKADYLKAVRCIRERQIRSNGLKAGREFAY